MVLAALFLTIEIILSRFLSISTPILKIGFGFLPLMLSAVILGPKYSVILGGLADFIGSNLFPTGPYFPGFLLSGMLSGYIYGVFLYKNPQKIMSDKQFLIRLIVSVFLVLLFVNTILNTIWILIIQKRTVYIVFFPRLLKQLIMFPIQVMSIYWLEKWLRERIKFLFNL